MSDEEIQIKQRARRRLIGAVTLVTGMVVFLPMVLDNEPKPVAEDIAINIPSQDAKIGSGAPQKIGIPEIAAPEIVAPKSAVALAEQPAASLVQPVVAPSGQTPKAALNNQPELVKAAPPKAEKPAADSAKHAPPKETRNASAAEKPKPPVKAHESKPTETPAAAQGNFIVRLGAFSKPENAKQLKAKVAALGIHSYTEILKSAAGDKTLVRAGPYATRKEAETARDRLKAGDVVGDVVSK